MKHRHTALTAAKAVRALLLSTSRIARTWPEYWQQQADNAKIAPRHRALSSTWASSYQAYMLTNEQVHGPAAKISNEQADAIREAIGEAMPELFAEYWDALPQEITP